MAIFNNTKGTTEGAFGVGLAGANPRQLVATADGVEVQTLGGALTKIIGSNTEPFKTSVQRIQLANLPSATQTGTQFFGPTLPANQLVLGGLVYLNAAVNAGQSGITLVQCGLGVGNVSASDNIQVTADVTVFNSGSPLSGPYPRYLHAYTTPSDFFTGLGALGVQSQAFYTISAQGANLDQLSAFDVTFVMVVADLVLPVP